ncbi:MAG: amidohydrolase family protein [Clostridia bacterium]|nr:amidohydrolase family protein [Clostridia bacterium]
MGKILIKNGRLWDGEAFSRADILTDGDRVAKIEDHLSEPADFTYDAAGQIVSAGLVDIHVHMRGISSHKFGIQAEMSCFPFGVTAAADASGAHGDRALADSFMLKNVIFAKVGFQSNRADFTETEERLSCFGDRAAGIKAYFDTKMSEVTDILPLREACDFAHARGLRVMVHCSNSPVPMAEILNTLASGDILTHAFHGGVNKASEDGGFEVMKRARARGVIIDAGMAGHVHTDFAVLESAVRQGILPNTISTDITRSSAYKRGGRYGMTMCMNIAKAVGMGEADIFRAVTSAPAAALGKEREWGHLAVGRCADIAVFDDRAAEPFDLTDKAGNRVQGTEGYRCVLTVSDGEVVYRTGR